VNFPDRPGRSHSKPRRRRREAAAKPPHQRSWANNALTSGRRMRPDASRQEDETRFAKPQVRWGVTTLPLTASDVVSVPLNPRVRGKSLARPHVDRRTRLPRAVALALLTVGVVRQLARLLDLVRAVSQRHDVG
jgi:hypothetical protein